MNWSCWTLVPAIRRPAADHSVAIPCRLLWCYHLRGGGVGVDRHRRFEDPIEWEANLLEEEVPQGHNRRQWRDLDAGLVDQGVCWRWEYLAAMHDGS